MKTTITSLLIAAASVAVTTPSADAADPHIDDLAYQVKNLSARAYNEARYLHGFGKVAHLRQDLYEMYTLADHVHEVTHNSHDYRHVADDVAKLDELFHHVEEVYELAERTTYARRGSSRHGHGRYHSGGDYHFNRLGRLLTAIEDTIHHMQEDLEPVVPVAPPVITPVPTRTPYPGPVYNPRPSGPRFPSSSKGFSIYKSNRGRVVFSLNVR